METRLTAISSRTTQRCMERKARNLSHAVRHDLIVRGSVTSMVGILGIASEKALTGATEYTPWWIVMILGALLISVPAIIREQVVRDMMKEESNV